MINMSDKPTHDLYVLFRDGDDEELLKVGTISQGEDGIGTFHIRWIPTSGWRNRGFVVPHGAPPPDLPAKRPADQQRAKPPAQRRSAQPLPENREQPFEPLPGEEEPQGLFTGGDQTS
jgi:hypothetical protein